MHSHRLIVEKDAAKAEWVLEWDESTFRLKDPSGDLLDAPTNQAYRLVETCELHAENKIRFDTPDGPLIFKRQKAAAMDLKALVESGLKTDSEYRSALARQSRATIVRGLAMFVIGAVPFALYCWWAARAPDPSPGQLRTFLLYFGWLIHLLLIVCLGLAIGGPAASYFGFKQLRRVRRIERGFLRVK